MKNFNIIEGSLKNLVFRGGGGGVRKKLYVGGNCLNGGGGVDSLKI